MNGEQQSLDGIFYTLSCGTKAFICRLAIRNHHLRCLAFRNDSALRPSESFFLNSAGLLIVFLHLDMLMALTHEDIERQLDPI